MRAALFALLLAGCDRAEPPTEPHFYSVTTIERGEETVTITVESNQPIGEAF